MKDNNDSWYQYRIVGGEDIGYAGTQGWSLHEGWARYRNDVSLEEMNSQMPPYTVGLAGDLWSSWGKPAFASHTPRSELIIRKIKIEWCCLPGATDEQRKSKVVDIFPKSDQVYIPK